jgi:hypothetical protein
MSWLEKLKVTRFQMAILLTVLAILPVFLALIGIPLVLPLTRGQITIDFYNCIQQLPAGSKVAWANQLTFKEYLGKRDVYRAIIYQLFDRKCKVVMCSFAPDTPQIWLDMIALSGVKNKYGVKEGIDYVIFPYLPGDEVALATVAANFHSAFATDIRGVPIQDIPLMQEIHTLKDFQLSIVDAWSNTFIDMFARQWPATYGVKAISHLNYPTAAPYYGTLIQGVLDGVRGYAEYESLTGYAGEELLKLDSRNMQGLLLIILLTVGNLAYIVKTRKKETPEMLQSGRM